MVDPSELEILLARSAIGDRAAFQKVYDLTSVHLFSVLLRMLKNRELAEEALQDVYIKIWQKAETFNADRGKPMTWMMSVARYRALDLLRKTTPEIGEEPDPETPDTSIKDIESMVHESKAMDALSVCVGELTEQQKQSVLLAYFEGYTHEEISARLERPLGTVKSWVRRGLSALKACMERPS